MLFSANFSFFSDIGKNKFLPALRARVLSFADDEVDDEADGFDDDIASTTRSGSCS